MNCSLTADYSAVQAERRIPFIFTLDLDTSVLSPGEGENQCFCYRVRGVGANVPEDADLSHFVLGVCPELTLEDIVLANILIDGVSQEVILGENVTVMTAGQPDPTTGCSGIKIDFGLNKAGGEMIVCLTLARAFSVGQTRVCVNSEQETLNNLFICGPACAAADGCQTTVNQRASVCVPVTVTPYAITGTIATRCCGAPSITPGRSACTGNPNQSCTFTVSQELCLNIPLAFGANAVVGAASTLCEGVSQGECICGEDTV